MRKIILLGFCLLMYSVSFAQDTVAEPEFIGESFILNGDNSTDDLEKETVQIKTRAGVSVYLTGIGKVKSKIRVENCCSNTRTKTSKDLQIIVKAVDNKTDPLSIVQIFEFKSKRKKRLAEVASSGTFSGGSSNNLKYVKFKGKKYGESSYLLTIKNIKPGEYGVMVRNPNSLDEKTLIVSTFGVD